jgi:hypothetical protein
MCLLAINASFECTEKMYSGIFGENISNPREDMITFDLVYVNNSRLKSSFGLANVSIPMHIST